MIQQHHKETAQQFLRFAIIGTINTGVDFLIYIGLTRGTHLFDSQIYLANSIAFLTATVFSFFANRTWTFGHTHKPSVGEATKFFLTTGSGFIINTAILYFVVEGLSGHDILGKVLATGCTMFWNFALNKLWVFNKK